MQYYLTQTGFEFLEEARPSRKTTKRRLGALALAAGAGILATHKGVKGSETLPSPPVISQTTRQKPRVQIATPPGTYPGPGDTVPGGAAGHRVGRYKGPGDTVLKRRK